MNNICQAKKKKKKRIFSIFIIFGTKKLNLFYIFVIILLEFLYDFCNDM